MATAVIYELEIELLKVMPRIWRRVAIAKKATFFELHVAIQSAMGWRDSHLHSFSSTATNAFGDRLRYELPDPGGFADNDAFIVWEHPITDLLTGAGAECRYWYDFGDDWMHRVTVKAERPKEKGEELPRCLAGENACPPEDVGGAWGYEEFLAALADPSHPDHELRQHWWTRLAECFEYDVPHRNGQALFDPTAFDVSAVRIPNPRSRLREVAADFGYDF